MNVSLIAVTVGFSVLFTACSREFSSEPPPSLNHEVNQKILTDENGAQVHWAELNGQRLRCARTEGGTGLTLQLGYPRVGQITSRAGKFVSIDAYRTDGMNLIGVKNMASGFDPSSLSNETIVASYLHDVERGAATWFAFDGDMFVVAPGKDELVSRVLGKLKITKRDKGTIYVDQVVVAPMGKGRFVTLSYLCANVEHQSSIDKNASYSQAASSPQQCFDYVSTVLLDPRLRKNASSIAQVRDECERPRQAVCLRQKIYEARKEMADDDPIRTDVVDEWWRECERS